ncbi:CapA family protein [Candidatus Gracilibacteria bacterium]|nr:CapA family protein [Candidatus Gracilibacteria bacterium]
MSAAEARPPSQRADGLDTPLLQANACGVGADEIHFTIAATGDTFPHENIQRVAEANGYDYLFDYVRPYLQAADLAYTNFDGAMLASSPSSGYPNFNFNPALAPALKNAGIDVVSTANNHILDRGPEGLDATIRVLDEAGIAYHGTVPSSFGAQPRPPFLTIPLVRDGITVTIGFISATWGTNGIPDPYNQVNLLYQSNAYGEQGGVRPSVLDAIAQAAAATDVVLVAAHWGFEYEFYPRSSQIEAAQAMAAAGADIILGAQPHTLQPVDFIDSGGRKTLVAYSLANFIASQGAFQATAFSATSVIFYVGIARSADGNVRVTGYRYLPTLHIDNDTRPAPIVAQTPDTVITHVRTILRDPSGILQVPAAPPPADERIEVCPSLQFAEAPQYGVPGDFAQHYRTLGGLSDRPPTDALRVLGYPLGPVTRELAGDCQTELSVLLTERQRLEWHAAEAWPYRVQGSQLGVAVFEQKYGPGQMDRRTSLDGDAFADPRFQRFYEAMGGLSMFGFPISRLLIETDDAGVQRPVQYFERARFELDEAAEAGAQVKLGLLGREYKGIANQCGLLETAASTSFDRVGSTATLGSMPTLQGDTAGFNWTPWLLILLVTVLVLGGLTYLAYRREQSRREFYRKRAYQRRATLRRNTAQSKQPPSVEVTPARQANPKDDDLLSDLLQMDDLNRRERE